MSTEPTSRRFARAVSGSRCGESEAPKMFPLMRHIIAAPLLVLLCCGRVSSMQTFSIGPTLIDLSNFLETRIEDDTLVAYPPRTDFVVLRFTVISTVKDGKDVAGSGEKSVRESAIEDKAQLQVCGDKVWYHVDKLSSNGSPGSLMHYWYVALGGHTLVASCFVDAAESNNALTKRVLSLVEPAILSFRRKPE